MGDHSLACCLRVLLFNCLKDIVMLFVAILQGSQILVKTLDASGIDLLQGLHDGQKDRIVGRLCNLRVESTVILIELDDILLSNALADILQDIPQHLL